MQKGLGERPWRSIRSSKFPEIRSSRQEVAPPAGQWSSEYPSNYPYLRGCVNRRHLSVSCAPKKASHALSLFQMLSIRSLSFEGKFTSVRCSVFNTSPHQAIAVLGPSDERDSSH